VGNVAADAAMCVLGNRSARAVRRRPTSSTAIRRLRRSGTTGHIARMKQTPACHRLRLLLRAVAAAAAAAAAAPALAVGPDGGASAQARETPAAGSQIDRSGKKRVGTASVYARRFAGRKMADGNRMDPHEDNAASKTLPLGTEAKVTNLETGRSTTVTIQDRGPYVKGRIVDLSPGTADKLGITPKEGVAKVEVEPIALPPREQRGRD
jgi:rare lipoprotein A